VKRKRIRHHRLKWRKKGDAAYFLNTGVLNVISDQVKEETSEAPKEKKEGGKACSEWWGKGASYPRCWEWRLPLHGRGELSVNPRGKREITKKKKGNFSRKDTNSFFPKPKAFGAVDVSRGFLATGK